MVLSQYDFTNTTPVVGDITNLDRLHHEDRLGEGEEEGDEPLFRLGATPLEGVEDGEEGAGGDGQEDEDVGDVDGRTKR